MQISVKVLSFVQEILSIISLFGLILADFPAVTLKIRSRSQRPIQDLSMSKCYIMQSLVKIKLLVQEILRIISHFGLNLACFVYSDLEN